MALNGYMTDIEEPAPITSRSPSFVRVASSVDDHDGMASPDSEPRASSRRHLPIEELVTESERPTLTRSGRPSVSPASSDSVHDAYDSAVMRARAAEHSVDLDVRSLQLEESLHLIRDARVAGAVRSLVDDIGEIHDFLRSGKLDDFPALVQHVYEWAVNVIAQADARVVAASRGETPVESIGLTVAEYSSLFVRAILLPTIESAVEDHEGDRDGIDALGRLRDLVAWANWTLRTIAQ